MTTHLEESLERDIERIRANVREMAGLAERALKDGVKALVEKDRQLAYAVILRDQYVDEKEKEIDRLCLEFLIRQTPVAGTLRFVYSTIRINLELERVGDYAESIARQVLRLYSQPLTTPVPTEGILELASLSIPALHDATDSFFRQDADLARRTIAVEPTVDLLFSKLNADLYGLFHDDKIPFEVMDPLMNVGRRLERVSDQARNISLEVLYMCTGEYAKHSGADTFRVLFVDEHNSCLSQMAEALARSLNQPKFIFYSAGLEPRRIDLATLEFMKEKGFDLSRNTPKALFQVPYIEQYQVLVSFSTDVVKAMPQHSAKMIFLDWSVPDPSKVKGTPEEVRAAYEAAFEFISSQVRDLVEAVLGNKIK
jgi:phosphate transport system protein